MPRRHLGTTHFPGPAVAGSVRLHVSGPGRPNLDAMLLRRWLALPALAALVVAAAACGGDDKAAQVDTEPARADLAGALSLAQSAMPVDVSDSQVRLLIGDLCEAGPADVDVIVGQIAGMSLADQAQLDAALQGLDAGTADYCPDAVDPAVRAAVADGAQAALPIPTTPAVDAPASAGSPSGVSGGSGSTGAAPAAGSNGATSASNGSSGAATAGGGNATGSGNQSSTGFTQSVGSGSSTNDASAG